MRKGMNVGGCLLQPLGSVKDSIPAPASYLPAEGHLPYGQGLAWAVLSH